MGEATVAVVRSSTQPWLVVMPSSPPSWAQNSRLPADLLDRLGSECLIVVGRCSGSSGTRAARLAVNDLINALRHLEVYGADMTEVIESIDLDELVKALRTADPVVTAGKGKKFTNRFVEIDFTRKFGLYLVVSMGTGSKLDAATLEQPFTSRLVEIGRHLKFAAIVAKRVDRLGRNKFAFMNLMQLIEHRHAWFAAEDDSLGVIDDGRAITLFVKAQQAEKQALIIPRATRLGMIDATETRMENGRARLGVGLSVPPGFAAVRMRDGARQGDSYLVLDDPKYLPSPSEVSFGLPEVIDPETGSQASQVENVRWALERIGAQRADGMWTPADIVEGLESRRYTTDAYRRRYGPGASYFDGAPGSSPMYVLRTLASHLDLYETGVLRVNLGLDMPAIEIRDCLPCDGPWASPEDLARIRAYIADLDARSEGQVTWTFSGLPIGVNGLATRLTPAYGSTDAGYTTGGGRGDERHSTVLPAIPHRVIADAVVAAIAAAGSKALLLVADAVHADEEPIRRATAELERTHAHHTARLAALREQLGDTDADGNRILRGGALKLVSDDIDELIAKQRSTEVAIEEQRDELARVRLQRASDTSALGADRLLHLVASLKDPHDTRWRHHWRHGLVDLAVESRQAVRHSQFGYVHTLSGFLELGEGSHRYRIPLEATFQTRSLSKIDARVADVLEQMRQGVPFAQVVVPRRRELAPAVAARLGFEGDRCALLANVIPQLVMIATHVMLERDDWRGGSSATALAAELNAPIALVERVAELYLEERPHFWRKKEKPRAAKLYRVASEHPEGIASYEAMFGKGARPTKHWHNFRTMPAGLGAWSSDWEYIPEVGFQLVATCPTCCGNRFGLLRFAEPVGPLCLDCRRDRSGLHWPHDPYDYFLDQADIWADIGLIDLDVANRSEPHPRIEYERQRRERQRAEKTARRSPVDGESVG